MKTVVYIILALLVLAGGLAVSKYYPRPIQESHLPTDVHDLTFTISDEEITLKNGISEVPAALGSAEISTTHYFGNEAKGDLNGDGIPDLVFLITQQGGGTGTFFFLVGAIQMPDGGYQGTEAVLIGDRIAPQTTEFRDGLVIVNYADRAPGEPMTAQPSVGKSLYLKYDPVAMNFGEVVQNFEGEADPKKMTLNMKQWTWISALYNDGTKLAPKQTQAFSLTFGTDGKFTATTDCNAMGGSYSTNQGALTLSNIYATKKYCAGSQESDFAKLLENSTSYLFTSKGELVLELKYDSGTATFR